MPSVRSIRSRDNPLLARARKLAADAAAYRKLGALWIEGEHLCSAWLRHGHAVAHAVIGETAWTQRRLRDLAERAATVSIVPDALLSAITSLESAPPLAFEVALPASQAIAPSQPTVVLDRLQDAGNVGAILRTAAAFGYTQVVAIKGTAALWSRKVVRAGMGAHFGLRLIEGVDSVEGLDMPLLATSSHAGVVLASSLLPWPCAWVFGHEGQGVSAALRSRCAISVRIPQPGGEESLNVAAAAAICLYESVRQRAA